MIKPWLFEFFHSIRDANRREQPTEVQDHFKDYVDLWVQAEGSGWEGIFFSEHHFGPGYSPSPNLVISHVAARTKTLRLGAIGTVSGYATPWRVAEEFAMLDHLTQGRLEMGVVSGLPPELAVVGISREHALEVHAEVIDVLLSAVSKPLVSHRGKHFTFDDIRLTPSFLQASPPVWTACTSAESARRAGERGMKMCSGFAAAEQLVPAFEAYQEGAKSAGHPTGPDRVAIRRAVTLVETQTEAEGALGIATEGSAELFRGAFEAFKLPDAGDSVVQTDDLIYGTPDQVADEIIRQCTILGAGHFVAGFNVFDREDLHKHHELFAKHVIPRLRAAKIG